MSMMHRLPARVPGCCSCCAPAERLVMYASSESLSEPCAPAPWPLDELAPPPPLPLPSACGPLPRIASMTPASVSGPPWFGFGFGFGFAFAFALGLGLGFGIANPP